MGIPPPSQQQQGSSRHPLLLVEDLGSVLLAHGLGFVQSGGCCRWISWWENDSLFFIGTLACPIAREHAYSWGLWRRVVEYVIFTRMHFSFGKCGPVGMPLPMICLRVVHWGCPFVKNHFVNRLEPDTHEMDTMRKCCVYIYIFINT